MSIVWLALIVIFLIVEIATVGLTSIWLAGGALAALVVELLGLGIVWQIAAFSDRDFYTVIFYETLGAEIFECEISEDKL